MESLCARQWWGDHWGGWGPSWLFHIARCFPQGMSPYQPPPWGKQTSRSLFFWFHPRSFLLQPTSFLQVPQSIGLSTRKVPTFINITDIVSSLTVVTYLEHFLCGVSLWCPDGVVRFLQEVLEGVEGFVLSGYGQEGGVGGWEVLKEKHASKHHQGENYSARCVHGGVFLALNIKLTR